MIGKTKPHNKGINTSGVEIYIGRFTSLLPIIMEWIPYVLINKNNESMVISSFIINNPLHYFDVFEL